MNTPKPTPKRREPAPSSEASAVPEVQAESVVSVGNVSAPSASEAAPVVDLSSSQSTFDAAVGSLRGLVVEEDLDDEDVFSGWLPLRHADRIPAADGEDYHFEFSGRTKTIDGVACSEFWITKNDEKDLYGEGLGGYAFGITSDDVLTVCEQEGLTSVVDQRKAIAVVRGEVDRVESSALDGGTEMDDQTEAAHDEIKEILVEKGLVKRDDSKEHP